MRKTLAVFLLSFLGLGLAFAQKAIPADPFKAIPDFQAPAAQADDGVVVQTTAGAMRKALAFREDDLALRELVNGTVIPKANEVVKAYNESVRHPKLSLGQKITAVLAVIAAGLIGYAVGR